MKPLWTPSPTHRADPGEVLREAMTDASEGRHQLALQKHLWFHKNATRLQPSLSGVRRSYALRAWAHLTNNYKPAHTALLKVRDAAQRSVWKHKDPWSAFHDFSSINRYLDDEQPTAALFKRLDRRAPKRAKRVYRLVEPILVNVGDYQLCGKYLEPIDALASIRRSYRVNLRLSKDPSLGPDLDKFAQCRLTEKATILIGLLALNDRAHEARQVASKARRIWNNREFHQRIDFALHGRIFTGHT